MTTYFVTVSGYVFINNQPFSNFGNSYSTNEVENSRRLARGRPHLPTLKWSAASACESIDVAAFISPLTFFKSPFFIALLLKIPLRDSGIENLLQGLSWVPQEISVLYTMETCQNKHLTFEQGISQSRNLPQTLSTHLYYPSSYLTFSVLRCKSLLGAAEAEAKTDCRRLRPY